MFNRVVWLTIKNMSLAVGSIIAFISFFAGSIFLGEHFLDSGQTGLVLGLCLFCLYFLVHCAYSSARFQVDRENFELMRSLRKKQTEQA